MQQRLPPMASCIRPRLILAIDTAIAMFVIMTIALIEIGVYPSQQKGFWCTDPSISYKFRGDTITPMMLAILTLISPLVIMFCVEHWAVIGSGSAWKHIKMASKRMMRWYKEYVTGLFLALFIIEVMKAIIGEPRPHFLDSCRPEPGLNCTQRVYITNYKCTNTAITTWNVRESTRSFPSGHSGLSCYTSLFMVFYLHYRARQYLGSRFATPFVQALYLCYAIACSVTRITDHRHHWWDVIVGAGIGIAGAVFTVQCFCQFFKSQWSESKEPTPVKFGTLVGLDGIALPTLPNGNDRTRHQSARRLLSDISQTETTTVPGHQLA